MKRIFSNVIKKVIAIWIMGMILFSEIAFLCELGITYATNQSQKTNVEDVNFDVYFSREMHEQEIDIPDLKFHFMKTFGNYYSSEYHVNELMKCFQRAGL